MDGEKKMFQGDWVCSGCSKSITELPFEPKDTSNLTCKECYFAKKDAEKGERKMYSGDWKCASCSSAITELPFEPRDTSNLKCRDCFKKG